MLGASAPWASSFIRTFLSLPPIDNYWMCQSREETMPSRLVDTWPDLNYEVASVNWGSSVAQLITCYQTGHRSASDWCNSSPCRFVMIEPVLIVPAKQIRNTLIFSRKDTISWDFNQINWISRYCLSLNIRLWFDFHIIQILF